jgi:hypothetical protein
MSCMNSIRVRSTPLSCNLVFINVRLLNKVATFISPLIYINKISYTNISMKTNHNMVGGHRGRMVVGFTTTCAISAHHHR